ncbi:hypothetical protein Tsubulata_018345, partial [Turnera subulata]
FSVRISLSPTPRLTPTPPPPPPLKMPHSLLHLRPLPASSSSPPPPCFTSNFLSPCSSSSSSSCGSFSFSLRPTKRYHFLTPFSALKQSRKQQQQTLQKSRAPQSLKWFLSPKGDDDGDDDKEKRKGKKSEGEGGMEGDSAVKGTLLAGVLLVGFVGGFAGVGYVYREQINAFLTQFSGIIDGYGPAGYALFVAVYAGLEILAIPAIPLTMSAGLLFGSTIGTIIVSISGTVAASVAFLIARYFARDRILKLVEGNKKFLAIDKAIGENGFRIVTLLRLSPLLPFSLGNYLYGLTSVNWLGMLPGTWAYVSAGAFGRAIIISSKNKEWNWNAFPPVVVMEEDAVENIEQGNGIELEGRLASCLFLR